MVTNLGGKRCMFFGGFTLARGLMNSTFFEEADEVKFGIGRQVYLKSNTYTVDKIVILNF